MHLKSSRILKDALFAFSCLFEYNVKNKKTERAGFEWRGTCPGCSELSDLRADGKGYMREVHRVAWGWVDSEEKLLLNVS